MGLRSRRRRRPGLHRLRRRDPRRSDQDPKRISLIANAREAKLLRPTPDAYQHRALPTLEKAAAGGRIRQCSSTYLCCDHHFATASGSRQKAFPAGRPSQVKRILRFLLERGDEAVGVPVRRNGKLLPQLRPPPTLDIAPISHVSSAPAMHSYGPAAARAIRHFRDLPPLSSPTERAFTRRRAATRMLKLSLNFA